MFMCSVNPVDMIINPVYCQAIRFTSAISHQIVPVCCIWEIRPVQ
jgi:hypothetical protein